MDRTYLKGEVIKVITERKQVSYVEIEELFENLKFDYKGEYAICPDDEKYRNIVYWLGWNQEAISLISELRREKFINYEPCNLIIYLLDGKGLDMPLVKHLYPYKEEHWLPLVFVIGERRP